MRGKAVILINVPLIEAIWRGQLVNPESDINFAYLAMLHESSNEEAPIPYCMGTLISLRYTVPIH